MTETTTGFLSYARHDIVLASEFMIEFRIRAAARSDLNIELWHDEMIDTGEIWFEVIKSQMDEASVAVMLLSPAFAISEFIKLHEITHFIDNRKILLLPLLVSSEINRLDLGMLDGLQIYRYRPQGQQNELSYQECDDVQRGRFIDGLLSEASTRLKRTL